jgi:hypothetical protein
MTDLLDAAKLQKLQQADIANLIKQVASGKPLTKSQWQRVREAAGAEAGATTFAPSQSALAEALGITRQRLQWWVKKDGNPGRRPDGRYHIADWRAYLSENGVQLHGDGDGELLHLNFGDGLHAAVHAIAPGIVNVVSVWGLGQSEQDELIMALWFTCASMIDRVGKAYDVPSYFDPDDEDGSVHYPHEIVAVANRIGARGAIPQCVTAAT